MPLASQSAPSQVSATSALPLILELLTQVPSRKEV